tara:strand:- start:50918 stop:51739 length:822 start_codon:yes stop_codon:yes gene_type:complete
LELLDDEEFQIVQGVARQYFGFELTADKRTMLSRRLKQFAESEGLESAGLAVRQRLLEPNKEILLALAIYLTTNHTYFHREHQHFDRLVADVLPELQLRLGDEKDLRIWSAAASTGEEPYEIAMCVAEVFGSEGGWKKAVLATDISERVLATAKAATYTREQVAKLPVARLRDFMVEQTDSSFTVSNKIRDLLSFRRLNLLGTSYPFRRALHVIFCRNAMIYFEPSARAEVLKKLSSSLAVGGYLFLGRSESARGMEQTLQFIEPGFYKKVCD